MHTTTVLGMDDFTFSVNGKPATLESVFPGFNKQDRLGVVTRDPGGGLGASMLILAVATRFYDFYRPELGNEAGKLRIYPETFTFHIGQRHMSYAQLDVWPLHKEIIVPEDPEQILEAINDRAITRLLVEDRPAVPAQFLRETLASAQTRMVSAAAYSPSGRVGAPTFSISSGPAAEQYVDGSIIHGTEALTEETREHLRLGRKALVTGGGIMETYRTISLADALNMLI